MGVNDFGGDLDPLNYPNLPAWAASVAAALDNSDTSVDDRIAYLEGLLTGLYVAKSGDTMTGNLSIIRTGASATLSVRGDPAAGISMYADNASSENARNFYYNAIRRWKEGITAATWAIQRFDSGGTPVDTPLTIENANGRVSVAAAPVAGTNVANKTYVDGQDALQVSKTGDTMSGTLISTAGTPLQINNQATFQAKNSAGTYETFMWPRWSDDKMYVNYGSGGLLLRNSASAAVLTGDPSGYLTLGQPTPTAAAGIASKGYVDGLTPQYATATASGSATCSGNWGTVVEATLGSLGNGGAGGAISVGAYVIPRAGRWLVTLKTFADSGQSNVHRRTVWRYYNGSAWYVLDNSYDDAFATGGFAGGGGTNHTQTVMFQAGAAGWQLRPRFQVGSASASVTCTYSMYAVFTWIGP